MIYTIGDTHFNHVNIIKYCDRPFYDVFQMNERIIYNWNCVVGENDLVIHVGDFVFGHNRYEDYSAQEIMERLNGDKILIKGNHDRMSLSKYRNMGFKEVHKKSYEIDNFIFTHRPVPAALCTYDQQNIHGHVHNNWGPNIRTDMYHLNVSCEVTDYTPVSLDKLKSLV